MLTHSLLATLRASKPAFGIWCASDQAAKGDLTQNRLQLPSVLIARTVALASPKTSWICIDAEHGLVPLQGPTLHEMISAVGTSASVIVRIPRPGGSIWQTKLALDAGAHGIMVPMVGSAAEARDVVADARFPPAGRRGFGSMMTNASPGWACTPAEYLAGANERVLVMLQIETREGLQNVEEIAAVDGVDVLFVGPYDLSIAHGIPPPSPDPHPEAEKLVQRVLAACKKNGKYAAMFCTSGEQAARRAAEGWNIINVTNDVAMLTESAVRSMDAATSSVSGKPEGRMY